MRPEVRILSAVPHKENILSDWWDDINVELDLDTGFSQWFLKSIFKKLCASGRAIYKSQFIGYIDIENYGKAETIIKEAGFKLLSKDIDYECVEEFGKRVYVSKGGVVTVNEFEPNKFAFSVDMTNESIVKKIHSGIKKLLKDVPPEGTIKMLGVNHHGGYTLVDLGRIDARLKTENYTREITQDYKHIIEEFSVGAPCGRLILLHGKPGTGKSFFIRGLISSSEAMFVFIPSSMVGSLSGPNLATCLISHKVSSLPTVLIVEDADSSLIKRTEGGNLGQLSDLLNIGDGLMGELADIRIVATTNSPFINIDPALVRPGRLCRSIEFKRTSNVHAKRIYKKLTDGKELELKGEITLAELYRKVRDEGWEPESSYALLKKSNYYEQEPTGMYL